MQEDIILQKTLEGLQARGFTDVTKLSTKIIHKNNLTYTGILCSSTKMHVNTNVVIPFTSNWEIIDESNVNFASLLEKQIDSVCEVLEALEENQDIVINLTKNQLLDNTICCVVSDRNKAMLEGAYYTEYLDMLVYYRYFTKAFDNDISFVVTNELLKKYNIAPEELHKIALGNLERKVAVKTMTELLEESGFPTTDMVASETASYVIYDGDNSISVSGVITSRIIKERIYKMLGKNYYILPSSIHELIVIPADVHILKEELLEMVKEINEQVLDPTDILTNSIYLYNGEEGVTTIYNGGDLND